MLWMLIFPFILPVIADTSSGLTWTHKKEDHLPLQYGKVGADVLLNCRDFGPDVAVEWRVNGTSIPGDDQALRINGAHLTVQKAQLPQEGEYSCHRPDTGETLARTQLQLGYPPKKPATQCRAVGYPETVRCSWRLDAEPLLNTLFITTYRLGIGFKELPMECVQSPLEANSCTINDFLMFSITPYVLNVTAVNALGSAVALHPFIVEEIIQPDPPENVSVSPITGETSKLRVRWDPPKSWPLPRYFPLKYMIRCQLTGSRNFRTLGPYEQTSVVLSGIWPRRMHTVQVNAKDFADYGEASAWSLAVSATPWTKP